MSWLGYVALALLATPPLLVLLEIFWFGGRCPSGGAHEWGPHPTTYLSSAWVMCSKCGGEDY